MSKRVLVTILLVVIMAAPLSANVMAQDEYAGYIRYPITVEPEHLDWFTQTTIATGTIIRNIFEGLASYNQFTGEIEPALAESWDISENEEGHQVYTFHLREGVMFHDVAGLDYGEEGRAVTAEDIRWSYLRAMSGDEEISTRAPDLAAILGAKEFTAGETDDVPGLVIVDDKTFQITLETPDRLFLINGTVGVVPSELFDQLGEAAFNTPVGTGPYQFVEWLPENRIVLAKNPDYWNPELPKNEGILYTNYGDANTALLDYREDNLDFLFAFPSGQRQAIIDEFGDEFNEVPGLHIRYWGFQFDNEFVANNPLVRQAFSHTLDRVTAWDIFAEGARFPATLGMLPPAMPAATPATIYEYDLDKAAALLEEAGFPGGEGLPVIKIYLYEPIADEAQVVLWQQALESLGVVVEFVVEGGSTYWDSIEQPEVFIYQTGWAAGLIDPSDVFDYLVLDGADNGHYERDDLDELLQQARAEFDPAVREELYQQVHDAVMADAAFIPSAYSKNSWLQKPWVNGFEPGGGGTYTANLANVVLDR
ncbi:MAG: ABC transporter substrate-binding protein [Anaerolineae bacterium]|nr:ABC transporter substrate-binding protein [Anaerolineae bacterium]